jgi:hypothetical protein
MLTTSVTGDTPSIAAALGRTADPNLVDAPTTNAGGSADESSRRTAPTTAPATASLVSWESLLVEQCTTLDTPSGTREGGLGPTTSRQTPAGAPPPPCRDRDAATAARVAAGGAAPDPSPSASRGSDTTHVDRKDGGDAAAGRSTAPRRR